MGNDYDGDDGGDGGDGGDGDDNACDDDGGDDDFNFVDKTYQGYEHVGWWCWPGWHNL